jgi:hypothetical protein
MVSAVGFLFLLHIRIMCDQRALDTVEQPFFRRCGCPEQQIPLLILIT